MVLLVVIVAQSGRAASAQAGPGFEPASELSVPVLQQLAWGVAALAVTGFLVWKVGLPAVRKATGNRANRIRSELAGADAARHEAEAINREYKTHLREAKDEAERIILEGRQQAARHGIEMERDLQRDLDAVRDRTAVEIESIRTRALSDARAEIAELASAISGQLAGTSRDEPETQRLIEDYLESQRPKPSYPAAPG